ncbi:GDSL family lipase [Candidatus Poribacteria bacterium]|nr:GDSL family lipase [Candidatus Poribacteria bacterium]
MGDLCIQDGQKILFIGDSITDCGRRGEAAPLGNGYVRLFAELVMAYYPDRDINYINTGIGGNRITDLKGRWHEDALDHKPDWLSIKIGINDLHSHLRGDPNGVTPEIYAEIYEELLDKTKKKIDCPIILIEPFYMSRDTSGQTFQSQVLDILPEYLKTVHKMHQKYKTRLVRTHDMFQEQLLYRDPSTFCQEPVHPNMTGHLLIAVEVLKTLSA